MTMAGKVYNVPLASWSRCSYVRVICRTVERASAPPPTVSVRVMITTVSTTADNALKRHETSITHTDVDLVALEWQHGDVMSRRQKTMEEELEKPSTAPSRKPSTYGDQSGTKVVLSMRLFGGLFLSFSTSSKLAGERAEWRSLNLNISIIIGIGRRILFK
jgi:hypothetical protein